MRDFIIRSNTNELGLRSNAIKDLCALILHQLVVGWIGKAHDPTYIGSDVVSTDHHTSHFDAIGPSFRLFPRSQPRELKTKWHYIVSIQLFQLLPSTSGFYNLHAF